MRISKLCVLAALVVAIQCQAAFAGRLFATAAGRGILEINPETGGVINRFSTPVMQGSADGLAFDGAHLYYLPGNQLPSTVYVLDPDDGGLVTSYALPESSTRMLGQGLTYLDGLLYVLDWGVIHQDILAIDPATGALVKTIDFNAVNPGAPMIGGALGSIRGPDALLVSTFDSKLPGEILEIDPATGLITRSFDHNLAYEDALGLTSLDGKIYVGDHTPPGLPLHDHILIFDRNGMKTGALAVTDPPAVVLGLQSLAGSGEVQVPEPSSMALLVGGLAGVAWLARRRRG